MFCLGKSLKKNNSMMRNNVTYSHVKETVCGGYRKKFCFIFQLTVAMNGQRCKMENLCFTLDVNILDVSPEGRKVTNMRAILEGIFQKTQN